MLHGCSTSMRRRPLAVDARCTGLRERRPPVNHRLVDATKTSPVVAKNNDSCGTASSLPIPKCATKKRCWNQRSHLLEPTAMGVAPSETSCWKRRLHLLEPVTAYVGTGKIKSSNHSCQKLLPAEKMLQPTNQKMLLSKRNCCDRRNQKLELVTQEATAGD